MREFLEWHHRGRPAKWAEVYILLSYGMSLSNYLTWNRDKQDSCTGESFAECLIGKVPNMWPILIEDSTMEEFTDFALYPIDSAGF